MLDSSNTNDSRLLSVRQASISCSDIDEMEMWLNRRAGIVG